MTSLLIGFLLVIHVIVSLLMIVVILMQRPRSEGLGAAFGGGMTENIFGAQTTHVLAKATTWLGGSFFVLTLLLAMLFARSNSTSTAISRELLAEPPVAEEPAAAPEEAVVEEEAIVVEVPETGAERTPEVPASEVGPGAEAEAPATPEAAN